MTAPTSSVPPQPEPQSELAKASPEAMAAANRAAQNVAQLLLKYGSVITHVQHRALSYEVLSERLGKYLKPHFAALWEKGSNAIEELTSVEAALDEAGCPEKSGNITYSSAAQVEWLVEKNDSLRAQLAQSERELAEARTINESVHMERRLQCERANAAECERNKLAIALAEAELDRLNRESAQRDTSARAGMAEELVRFIGEGWETGDRLERARELTAKFAALPKGRL